MQSEEEGLRGQIALGWVMAAVVLAITLGFMIIESSLVDNNFLALRLDPGPSVKWLVLVFALQPLMGIYVHLVHGMRPRIFRWVAFGVAAVDFLFFLLHHLSHWVQGQRPDASSHVLDITLEIVLFWVVVSSLKWARFPRHES